jgi:hypothetical protein
MLSVPGELFSVCTLAKIANWNFLETTTCPLMANVSSTIKSVVEFS